MFIKLGYEPTIDDCQRRRWALGGNGVRHMPNPLFDGGESKTY